jgi:hypothetical protein
VPDPQHPHPLDALVPDPTGLAPVGDEQEFATLVGSMVRAGAPRLFAVVQEYGERVDAHVAAWGMAFDDHTVVASTDRSMRVSARTSEDALFMFNYGSHIHARLVWVTPDEDASTNEGLTG